MTLNFRMFALRDLEKGEELEKVRGAPGKYVMVGGDWEKTLHDAVEAKPDDPDIQFAVGEFLSRGKACGCAKPELFVGEGADEFPYFDRAYRAGISDYWSLFRMGVHHMSGGKPDLAKAVVLFEQSLKEKADHVATRYNAAVAHFWLKEYASARKHSAQAVGRYGTPQLDADTYNVHARVELSLGDAAAAEKAFRKALELRPPHEGAFTGLLALLGPESLRRLPAARRCLHRPDYRNTYPSVSTLACQRLASSTPIGIARELAAREYAPPGGSGAAVGSLGTWPSCVRPRRTSITAGPSMRSGSRDP
jgi:tetratricopeptide (TPR) repeat protein